MLFHTEMGSRAVMIQRCIQCTGMQANSVTVRNRVRHLTCTLTAASTARRYPSAPSYAASLRQGSLIDRVLLLFVNSTRHPDQCAFRPQSVYDPLQLAVKIIPRLGPSLLSRPYATQPQPISLYSCRPSASLPDARTPLRRNQEEYIPGSAPRYARYSACKSFLLQCLRSSYAPHRDRLQSLSLALISKTERSVH